MPSTKEIVAEIPVIKTIASQKVGIGELFEKIVEHLALVDSTERKFLLLAERAYHLIQQYRMKNISKAALKLQIQENTDFNLYQFIQQYI